MSTIFYFYTDGQLEILNKQIEVYFCYLANEYDANWMRLLPGIQFSYNNLINITIKTTLFITNAGILPDFYIFIENDAILKGVPAMQNRLETLQ